MWNMKCSKIPVTIGATRIVTKGLTKSVEAMPVKHAIDSLKMTAILGTSHIMQKVPQSEISSLSGGDQFWFGKIDRKKMTVTRNNNHNRNITIIIPVTTEYSTFGLQERKWYQ
jgi:hypothetical protein